MIHYIYVKSKDKIPEIMTDFVTRDFESEVFIEIL